MKRWRWVRYLFWVMITIIWVSPLLITFFTSMKSLDELLQTWWLPPRTWHPENFPQAWSNGKMGRYILNSFIITVPSLMGTLFLSSMGAFALSSYRFRFAVPILLVFVAGMLVPFQMLMIPVYRFSLNVGIYDSYLGVILFHIAFQLGFCTFFLRNFMKTLPLSLFEAAKVDGARDFSIYWRIALPLVKPALAALATLEFTWIWNDYLWALVLIQTDRFKPVTLGITVLQGQWIAQWNLIAAGSLLAAAPPVLMFLLFQRYFIEGLTMGAIKE